MAATNENETNPTVASTSPDWRSMVFRYVNTVAEQEGVDFLQRGDWTQEEWDAIWDGHNDADPVWVERRRNDPTFRPSDSGS